MYTLTQLKGRKIPNVYRILYNKSKQNRQVVTTTCRVWKYPFFTHMVSIRKAGLAEVSLSCTCSSDHVLTSPVWSLLTKHYFSRAFKSIFLFKNNLSWRKSSIAFCFSAQLGLHLGVSWFQFSFFNPDFFLNPDFLKATVVWFYGQTPTASQLINF